MGFFGAPKRRPSARRPRRDNVRPTSSNAQDAARLDYDTLVARALNEAGLILGTLDGVVGFAESEWSVDQTQGVIQFKNRSKGTSASGAVQIVGSYLPEKRSWLWSWAKPSIDAKLTRNALQVKKYGERNGVPHLVTPSLTCEPDAAWELGAIACVLAGDQGVYRGDADGTKMVMNFGNLTIRKL
ncbi:MAG: hypothetical protein H0W72_09275 [Planctomycetes bacterium]|nr:hypothetical protein [Planctomycetota bacterium]